MFRKKQQHLYLGDFSIESCTAINTKTNFTKIGRLSLEGIYENKKVKIFECHNPAHARFVSQVMSHPSYKKFFPKVYAVHGAIIVSEWVQGRTARARDIRDNKTLMEEISTFFSLIHSNISSEILQQNCGFDYSKDLLQTRFIKCCDTLELKGFCERVLMSINKAYSVSRLQLSHPDISSQNIIISKKNNEFKIIDNELISISSFHPFDLLNFAFFLGTERFEASNREAAIYESIEQILNRMTEEDLMNIWLMRYVGARFHAGNIESVINFSTNSLEENLKIFPFLRKFRFIQ